MKRKHVALLIAFILALTYFQFAQDTNSGSTYSSKGHGARGLFLFLSEYYSAVPWLKPWKNLDHSETGSAMLVIAPATTHSPADLLSWVEAGNIVIAVPGMSAASEELSRSLAGSKVEVSFNFDALINFDNWPTAAVTCGKSWGEICNQVQALTLPLAPLTNLDSRPEDSILAGGLVIATIADRGKGKIILLSDVNLLSNDNLDKADNAKFIYQLISNFLDPEGTIYFDEFHHGFTAPAEPGELNKVEAVYALTGVLVLLIVLGALSRSVRLGDPIALPDPAVAESVDFCTAMGLLLREKCPSEALPYYLRSWRWRLEQRFGISSRLSSVEALAELNRAGVVRGYRDLEAAVKQLENGETNKLGSKIAQLESAVATI